MLRGWMLMTMVGALLWPALGKAQSNEPQVVVVQQSDAQSDKEPDKFDWLVLGTEVGFRSLRITRVDFDEDEEVPKFLPSNAFGVAPALSLGVRLWFVSLAARSELAFLHGPEGEQGDDAFRLWSIDGVLQFRAPLGRVQPYFLLNAGYSGTDDLASTGEQRGREARARGANAGAGIGVDWFVGDLWMVGAVGSFEGLFLSSRAPVSDLATPADVDTVGQARDRAREADGAIMGWSPSLALTAALRI